MRDADRRALERRRHVYDDPENEALLLVEKVRAAERCPHYAKEKPNKIQVFCRTCGMAGSEAALLLEVMATFGDPAARMAYEALLPAERLVRPLWNRFDTSDRWSIEHRIMMRYPLDTPVGNRIHRAFTGNRSIEAIRKIMIEWTKKRLEKL